MVAGGVERKDVQLLFRVPLVVAGYPHQVDCTDFSIPDLPAVVEGGVGLPDGDGRPMVCGGRGDTSNTILKSCHVYSKETKLWEQGPDMMEARLGATAVPMPDGNSWVFGGYWYVT